jgi:hypothetical protein
MLHSCTGTPPGLPIYSPHDRLSSSPAGNSITTIATSSPCKIPIGGFLSTLPPNISTIFMDMDIDQVVPLIQAIMAHYKILNVKIRIFGRFYFFFYDLRSIIIFFNFKSYC